MGAFAAGQVVTVPFPYSDLSGRKLRPALLLAFASHSDWIICQITSNPFSDPLAIELTQASFASGTLHHISYARPSKLFTANETLLAGRIGTLREDSLRQVRQAVIDIVQKP
jgi:mRNA interferase MazF